MKLSEYSVLICSCDGCVDILDAFFTLLKKYWPDLTNEIVLSTETIDYQNQLFNIKNVHPDNPKCTWTERITDAVSKCSSEQILFILDDFFLYDYVNVEKINQTMGWLKNDKNIATFTYWPLHHLSKQSKYDGFCQRTKYSRSKIAAIVGVWNKTWLLKYLSLTKDSIWKFEVIGNQLSKSGKFFALIDSQNNIFPYSWKLGLSSGKWVPETADLFKKNNIKINLERRGFIEEKYHPLQNTCKNYFDIKSSIFCGKKFIAPKKMYNNNGIFSQEYHLKHCKNCVRWIITDLQGFGLDDLDIIMTHKNGHTEHADPSLFSGTFKKINDQYIFNGYLPFLFICSKDSSPITTINIAGRIQYPASKKQLDKSYLQQTNIKDKIVLEYIAKNNRDFFISSESIGEIIMSPEIIFLNKNGTEIKKEFLPSTLNGHFKYSLKIPDKTEKIVFIPSKDYTNFLIYNHKFFVNDGMRSYRKKMLMDNEKGWRKILLIRSSDNKYHFNCSQKYSSLVITGNMKKPIPDFLFDSKLTRLASKIKRAIIK